MEKQILVLSEGNNSSKAIEDVLKNEGYSIFNEDNCSEALKILRKKHKEIGLVIAELKTGKVNGKRLFYKNRELFNIPFIFVFKNKQVGSIIDLMKEGAFYCFKDPVDAAKLQAVVEEAMSMGGGNNEDGQNSDESTGYADILGRHKKMRSVFDIIKAVAPSDATVLIQGESGVGKELVAKAIHNASSRAKRDMVVLNCGALPDTLLESELCGHVKGAFTGAVSDKPGKFEIADKGTLFLDEIGELPVHLQIKLLKFLQDRTFERIGGQKVMKTNVRIIAATNRDLRREVDEDRFRLDLYYRLHVVPVYVPSLKERGDDILLLSNKFLSHYAQKPDKTIRFSKEASQMLLKYSWPGNVRELENMIQQIVVLCQNEEIQPEDIPLNIRNTEEVEEIPPEGFDLQKRVADIEKRWIENALRQSRWNRTKTAQALGITRKVLFAKMKKNNITTPENESTSW